MVNLDRIPTDRAAYGSKLTIFDLDTESEVTYQLVTIEESDAKQVGDRKVADGSAGRSHPPGA